MFDQLLLVTIVVLGITFVRLLRRIEAGGRGYALIVGGVLGIAVAAMIEGSTFLGVTAMALTVLVVFVPWVFEALARWAFTRGRLVIAVRLAGLRAILMPGAGLARQQEILHGLSLLERDGVDRALEHFRGLADDTEDGGELTLINEQIVSMLFYGQRWGEGIAHYESRFHPRYAAVRPALALGLLRAYGESGNLDNAAGLLQALEDGPVGTDPRASSVLSQARLTFLAYAGAAGRVAAALTDERRRALGLSEASGALFRGISWARAGQPQRAQAELRQVETLATSSDDRVVDASRSTIADLEHGLGGPVELAPDLGRYVDAVGARLESFLRTAPRLRPATMLIATPALIGLFVALYVAVSGLGQGGMGLLRLGALTPQMYANGSWARVLTGLFVHADPIAAVLNIYALWLAAPLIERVYGTGRLIFVAVVPPVAGLLAALSLPIPPGSVLAGSTLVAMSVVAAALCTLLPTRSPALRSRVRRGLAVPLVLVATASLLAIQAGIVTLDVPWLGLLVSVVLGALLCGIIPAAGPVSRAIKWLSIPTAAAVLVAAGFIAREDPQAFAVDNRDAVFEIEGARLRTPAWFRPSEHTREAELLIPIQKGLVDGLELRTRNLVGFATATEAPADAAPTPTLFRLDPPLGHQLSVAPNRPLPPGFESAYEDAGGRPQELYAYLLRRNGEPVVTVIERPIGDDGTTVMLIASPPEAVQHAPTLYARILAHAEASR